MSQQSMAERNRATVAYFLEQTHSGNFAAVDETVAPGIVTHGFPCHSPQSRKEYKQFFEDFNAAFSNMEYRTLALVADDAHVAARFFVGVDHTGTYNGIAPTEPARGVHRIWALPTRRRTNRGNLAAARCRQLSRPDRRARAGGVSRVAPRTESLNRLPPDCRRAAATIDLPVSGGGKKKIIPSARSRGPPRA